MTFVEPSSVHAALEADSLLGDVVLVTAPGGEAFVLQSNPEEQGPLRELWSAAEREWTQVVSTVVACGLPPQCIALGC